MQNKNKGMHVVFFQHFSQWHLEDVEWLNKHTAWYNMQISVARNSETGTLTQLPAALGLTQK